MTAEYDLVIRGGGVADGRGGPIVDADVAVQGGTIAAVGHIAGRGREEIDAKGKLVTPGFVDIHTHYDGQAIWTERLNPSSWHGVTTVVMGNCGVGFAPVRAPDHDRLIELMEGVEDIPGAVLHEGLTWQWESFGEYLSALEERPHDIDFCAQLPHAALRVYVMGERATAREMATEDDIVQMRRLSAEAMRAGAIGFSTSRSINHRSVKGDPTPSLRASEAELTGIAMGLADAGRGVIELVSDFDVPDLESEFAVVRRVVEASRRPLSISLVQVPRAPGDWRKILTLIEEAVRDGLPIKAQVAPRPVGMLLGLQASFNPFSLHENFAEIRKKPLAEKLAAMRDPGLRARLLAEDGARARNNPFARSLVDFGNMFVLGNPPNYEPPREQSLATRAARAGKNPFEIAYDCLLENDGKDFLLCPVSNYCDYNLDLCEVMIGHPDCIMALGDGGAHVGMMVDASFPTYLLTHWGRDRAHGRFDPAWLVKRQTADNARAVGLHDRGILAPGMKADINVLDFDALRLDPPTMAYDLPTGGKRFVQRAHGYEATIVSGKITYRRGEATDALPGRLVRGPQAAPPVH